MGSESDGPDGPTTDELLAVLADRRRRRALQRVRDRSGPVAVDALASVVADGVARDEAETALVHRHLPKLVEIDLVEWDRDEGAVAPGDHPALSTPGFDEVLAVDEEGWDDVLRALADERRRAALATLARSDRALERRALARRVAAREAGVAPSEPTAETVAAVEVTLHHVHLPLLAEANLVARGERGIAYEGHPALNESWVGVDAGDRVDEKAAGPDAASRPSVRQVVELVE